MISMKSIVQDLLLALNIESTKKGFSYNLQSELVYSPKYNGLWRRQTIIQYKGNKLIKKNKVNTDINMIEFLSNEIKQYE